MDTHPTELHVSVPLTSIARLAVEAWRMRRDLASVAPEIARASEVRLRRVERVLEDIGVRTWDPKGLPIDGGLAVVVIDRVEAEGATPTVRETLQPIVFVGDRLAAWGEVVANVPAQRPVDTDPSKVTA